MKQIVRSKLYSSPCQAIKDLHNEMSWKSYTLHDTFSTQAGICVSSFLSSLEETNGTAGVGLKEFKGMVGVIKFDYLCFAYVVF